MGSSIDQFKQHQIRSEVPFDVSANVTYRKCMLCLARIVAEVEIRELRRASNGTDP